MVTTDLKDCTIDNRKYLCKSNRTCIDMKLVCDGGFHCPDKSDEDLKCSLGTLNVLTFQNCCYFGCIVCVEEYQCPSHNCSHDCVQTPSGPFCLCPLGYHQLSEKHCIDINECEKYAICDQKCRNTEGSYSCYCDSKYSLQDDKRTCKVNGDLSHSKYCSKIVKCFSLFQGAKPL